MEFGATRSRIYERKFKRCSLDSVHSTGTADGGQSHPCPSIWVKSRVMEDSINRKWSRALEMVLEQTGTRLARGVESSGHPPTGRDQAIKEESGESGN